MFYKTAIMGKARYYTIPSCPVTRLGFADLDSVWDSIIRFTSLGISSAGSIIIVVGVLGTIVAIIGAVTGRLWVDNKKLSLLTSMEKAGHQLIIPLLIGLDLFIAADIIHTVLEHTPTGLALLICIVAIRIALSYFLLLEKRSLNRS